MKTKSLFTLFSFGLLIGWSACGTGSPENKTQEEVHQADPTDADTMQNPVAITEPRARVKSYVEQSEEPLLEAARTSGLELKWLLDRTEHTDSMTFYVYHVGHDMQEEDGSNPRFATDAWVYVDSLSARLFAYDIVADSLIEWKGGQPYPDLVLIKNRKAEKQVPRPPNDSDQGLKELNSFF